MSKSNRLHEESNATANEHQHTRLSPSTVDALLFDLGGVIIDIDFDKTFAAWAQLSPMTFAEIRSQMSMDEPYRQHECGQIESAVYFQHLRERFKLDATDEQIEAGWNEIFVGEFTQTTDAILAVCNQIPCFAFSNTNLSHQRAWASRYARALTAFKDVFTSAELGIRKPDRAAFEAVAHQMGIELSRIVFFDDSAENIAGAHAVGMQTVFVSTPDDVINALRLCKLI